MIVAPFATHFGVGTLRSRRARDTYEEPGSRYHWRAAFAFGPVRPPDRIETTMENRGLLFIPDISGFARFVTGTEIEHSQRIVQELLEVVIEANQIGLEVSEIEGDAVLFFKFGESPDLRQLCQQVERTFRDFHERLAIYEVSRLCHCRACAAACNLTLKFITHYGEFTSYSVKTFEKLIGKDVILAHQLLKNDVDPHEYWLVTTDLLRDHPQVGLPPWINWRPGVKRTESGDVEFQYALLSELRERETVEPRPSRNLELPRKTKMFSMSREYTAHIITLFHATGDYRYRSQWQEGVQRAEELSHHLPRVGMRSLLVINDREETVYVSSCSFRPDRIEFSETDESRSRSLYFTLESIDAYRTRLTVDFYMRSGAPRELWFRMTSKRKMEASLSRSLTNLDAVVKELRVPVEY